MKLDKLFYSVFAKDLKDELSNLIQQTKTIFYIRPPMFLENNQFSPLQSLEISRPISFDSFINKKVFFIISNYDYWLKNQLKNFEIKIGEGLFTNVNFILRDEVENDYTSIEKNHILIEIRIKDIAIKNDLDKTFDSMYQILFNAINNVVLKYKKTNQSYTFKKFIPLKDLKHFDFDFNNKKIDVNEQNNSYFDYLTKHQFLKITKIKRDVENDMFNYSLDFMKKKNIKPFQLMSVENTLNWKQDTHTSESFKEEKTFLDKILDQNHYSSLKIVFDIDNIVLALIEESNIKKIVSNE